eukprot:TRINITY_DN1470_c0_g1_i3.p2 TRINITY_DN1470_c0_g1~~TRINITY_DN1470_c0_g1_i3.p2  ORF type:complete len:110 (+),score=28.56 TRINITY_DN1470_c0_g1_i3:358-687(+)
MNHGEFNAITIHNLNHHDGAPIQTFACDKEHKHPDELVYDANQNWFYVVDRNVRRLTGWHNGCRFFVLEGHSVHGLKPVENGGDGVVATCVVIEEGHVWSWATIEHRKP